MKFNEIEIKLTKWFKGRLVVLTLLKAIVIVSALFPYFLNNYTLILMVESIIMLGFFLIMTHEYLSI